MAKIELTVRQIMNLGLWSKVCDYKGWSEWIYNEGQIDDNEVVEFDDQFEKDETTVSNLVSKEELIEFKDAVDWMDGDSWFTTNTPRLINTLLHYESILDELTNEYEHMTDWHGEDGNDARTVMFIVDKFRSK